MLVTCIKIAVITFVYTSILTQAGMIFGKLAFMATKTAYKHTWTKWFLNPLILCGYCVCGQITLWTVVLVRYAHWNWLLDVVDFIFLISFAILIVHLLIKINAIKNT